MESCLTHTDDGNCSAEGKRLKNVADPKEDKDGVNKAHIESLNAESITLIQSVLERTCNDVMASINDTAVKLRVIPTVVEILIDRKIRRTEDLFKTSSVDILDKILPLLITLENTIDNIENLLTSFYMANEEAFKPITKRLGNMKPAPSPPSTVAVKIEPDIEPKSQNKLKHTTLDDGDLHCLYGNEEKNRRRN
ncbi:hypothetical protein PR048_033123 [Dryococelus australis]|uniref:Uncharacterized protein n=1 Tax=Dryococelus australis TaxID=614101 RepID=A0ABQ9G2P5_9NEOP|nr:hypothetical protein PR048_033123 [Dryococelus australis]